MVAGERRLIVDAERRANRAWQEDGLLDLTTGCVLLLIGAAWFGYRVAGWSPLVIFAAVLGSSWLIRKSLDAAKTRIADHRVGYFRPRDSSWTTLKRFWWAWAVAVAVVGAINGIGGDVIPGWQFLRDWWQLLLVAGGALYTAVTWRSAWYVAVALISLVFVGLGASGAISQESTFAWCAVTLGLGSLVMGAWRLARFLRHHRVLAGT